MDVEQAHSDVYIVINRCCRHWLSTYRRRHVIYSRVNSSIVCQSVSRVITIVCMNSIRLLAQSALAGGYQCSSLQPLSEQNTFVLSEQSLLKFIFCAIQCDKVVYFVV
jgi:hypothetical protein